MLEHLSGLALIEKFVVGYAVCDLKSSLIKLPKNNSLKSSMTTKLPPLPKPPGREMKGPTPWCNWAIKDLVIAGAYPASLSDEETASILKTLLEVGITTFVCLQQEVSIDCPEHMWRKGEGLRPYIHDAQRILRQAHDQPGSTNITQTKIDFLHLPILDGGIASDSAMDRLAEDCIARVRRGEKLYVHCWGGHGRTGTLIAVMLGRMYNLSYAAALHCTQLFHDARRYPQGVRSPTTAVQRAQVRRLLANSGVTARRSVTEASDMPAPVPSSVTTGAGRGAAVQSVVAGRDLRRSTGAPLSFQSSTSTRSQSVRRTASSLTPEELAASTSPVVPSSVFERGAVGTAGGATRVRAAVPSSASLRSSQQTMDAMKGLSLGGSVGGGGARVPSAAGKSLAGTPRDAPTGSAAVRLGPGVPSRLASGTTSGALRNPVRNPVRNPAPAGIEGTVAGRGLTPRAQTASSNQNSLSSVVAATLAGGGGREPARSTFKPSLGKDGEAKEVMDSSALLAQLSAIRRQNVAA